jgi:hypothetical protein
MEEHCVTSPLLHQ